MSAIQRYYRKDRTRYERAIKTARKKIQSGKVEVALIPRGNYCCDQRGCCPYWSCREGNPQFTGGYCGLSEIWDSGGLFDLLWDQCRTSICRRLLPSGTAPEQEPAP